MILLCYKEMESWETPKVTQRGSGSTRLPGLLSSLKTSFKSRGLYSLISGEWETQTERSIFSKAKLGGWDSGSFLTSRHTV